MLVARVIGNVTLSRCHPSLRGLALRVAVPLSLANLSGAESETGEELVLVDELNTGHGSLIALADSREAAQPFAPNDKPIDAYNAALIDRLDLEGLE